MRRGLAAVLVIAMCLTLAGCDLWMDGNYSSVELNLGTPNQTILPDDDLSSYIDLREIMSELVEAGTQSAVLYTSKYDKAQMVSFMELVIKYITESHPIGSYAVDKISYNISTNGARQMIAVSISYIHKRSEILGMKQAKTMEDAIAFIMDAMGKYDAGIVMLVDGYESKDIAQMVQSYAEENPQICMEVPQVSVNTYPERGSRRVLELSFTYKNSRSVLRSMQQTVQSVFSAAQVSVSPDMMPVEKLSQLYSFLMDNREYTMQTSITPTYSLLRYGVGDSKAFASVYAAMCRNVGLDCQVVTGTRAGEAWCWNAVLIDGTYYYVDLLRCRQTGAFLLQSFQHMTGYVWDYSAFGEEKAPTGVEEPTAGTEPEQPTDATEEAASPVTEPIQSQESTSDGNATEKIQGES